MYFNLLVVFPVDQYEQSYVLLTNESAHDLKTILQMH